MLGRPLSRFRPLSRALSAAVISLLAVTAAYGAGDDGVVVLTQVPCQFLESENGVDHGYATARKADCEALNARDGAGRLAAARVITLKPGSYVFRVTNKNVPYDLGFWLRSKGYNPYNPLHRVSLTSVSGGGLATGMTRDYQVTLEPGEYVYSCPLNPTPDYRLIVAE